MLKAQERISLRSIVQKASISLAITVIGTGLGILMRLILARAVDTQAFGDFMYVMSWVNILVVVCLWGLEASSLRFVPGYHALSEFDKLNSFFVYGLRRTTITALVIGGILIAVTALLQHQMSRDLMFTFWIASLLIPINTIISLARSMLLAFKHIVVAQLPWAILRPLFFLLVIAAIALLGNQSNAVEAFTIYTLLSTGILAFYLYALFSKTSVSVRSSSVYPEEKALWDESAKQLLSQSVLRLFNSQTDVILIGFFLGTAEVGIYTAAVTVVLLLDFSLNAVNTVVAPIFSGLYSQGKIGELQQVVQLTARGVTTYAIVASILIFIGGKTLLGLFGPEFIAAYEALLILMAGRFVNSFAGSVGFLMTTSGHEHIATRILTLSAVTSIVLNFLLIPALGIVGAALANSIAMITWNVLMYINVKRRLGIDPTILSSFRS